MEDTVKPQPSSMQGNKVSSNEEGQSYAYPGRTKSVVRERAVIRGTPRGFELDDKVKMQVEEHVNGIGPVVSFRKFTIKGYEETNSGWMYQLFDVEAQALYKRGLLYHEDKLTKEKPRRR